MPIDLGNTLIDAWKTNDRVTTFLVGHLSDELLNSTVPGAPRRTVRMIAGHIHNARCMWIRTLGKEFGIRVPDSVDRYKVERKELLGSLEDSGRGIAGLLNLGLERGGVIPASPNYKFRNLPLDVGHVLAYFVAHEAHHRGQIVAIARELGCRLPADVTSGIWQWSKRSKESHV